ncbi:MAG: bifunctional [glutamate--ammonia ligase]-adenylyl-L-tyrosine phosphorylase/[glutamate--ammonia-ligase] adenylyltransferase, partial [Burkholderiaceae bacterium]
MTDWRGARIALAELPALSHYVQRAVQQQSAAEQQQTLDRSAALPWTAERQRAEVDALLTEVTGDQTQKLTVALRRLRRRVLLSLIARDTTGRADLAEVVGTMTSLAELSIQSAVKAHAHELASLHGTPASADGMPQDLLVIGMGKLGGGELNVSSDIDLIFVYDEDGQTQGASAARSLTNHEFFARLGRRLIAALNDLTGDGFVFRVDMRLRPNGNAGPLAVSNAMVEEYLMAQGREWERFAWLKGRVVSAAVFAEPAQFEAQCAAMHD